MKKIYFLLAGMLSIILLITSCTSTNEKVTSNTNTVVESEDNVLVGTWEWYGKMDEFDILEEYDHINGEWQFKENGEVVFNNYLFNDTTLWYYEVTENKSLIITTPNEDMVLIGSAGSENDTICLMEYYEKQDGEEETVTKDNGSEIVRKQYQIDGKTFIEDDDGLALRKVK